MTEHERKLRPALAAIILVCFFMPFLKVSCGGQTFMEVSGFDMATGRDVQPNNKFMDMAKAQGFQPDNSSSQSQAYQSDPNNPGLPDSLWQQTPMGQFDQSAQMGQMEGMDGSVKAEPVAAAAMALAVAAFLAALFAGRRAKIFSGAAAALCAICLFVLKSRAGADIPPEAAMVIAVEWTTQFWVAVIGSGVLAGFTFHLLTNKEVDNERPRLVIQTYEKPVQSEKIPS